MPKVRQAVHCSQAAAGGECACQKGTGVPHKPCSLMMLLLDSHSKQACSRRQAKAGAKATTLCQGSASSSTSLAGAGADL